VSRDARLHWPAFVNGEIPPDWPLIGWVVMDNMATREGADHARLRRLVSTAFTARRVADMRPRIEQITADIMAELAAREPGVVVDLKREFAFQLPMRVICELFGVPEEGRAEVLAGGEVHQDTGLTPEEAAANIERWTNAIGGLVELKRQHPADDMTSALIAAYDEDGSQLTDDELIGTLFLMLAAGSETVMNLMSHTVLELLTHPEQRRQVSSGEVEWADVLEEVLRVQAPIAQIPFRFAKEDIELDGATIPKGEPILIAFAAIGRDPKLHGDSAADFDITREEKDHLSFGHGVHFCLGAALARMEAGVALPALFDNFPDLRLAVPVDSLMPMGSFVMNAYDAIPVTLIPR
jgi:cytochrome P450